MELFALKRELERRQAILAAEASAKSMSGIKDFDPRMVKLDAAAMALRIMIESIKSVTK